MEGPDEVHGRGHAAVRAPQPNPKTRPETTTRVSLALSSAGDSTAPVVGGGRRQSPSSLPMHGGDLQDSHEDFLFNNVVAICSFVPIKFMNVKRWGYDDLWFLSFYGVQHIASAEIVECLLTK